MATLHIVDDAGQQIVREITLLQLVKFAKHEGLHLIEALSLLGCSHHEEGTVIMHHLSPTASTLYFHGLVQVEVKKTCTAVAQHLLQQFKGVSLKGISLFGTPRHPYLLSFLTDNRCVLRLCQRGQWCKLRLRNISTRFPTRKILIDDSDGLVRIEITSHTDGDIIGHVPLLEIILDIRNRRILQMLLSTDGGLQTIRMIREEQLQKARQHFTHVGCQTDIIFLVHSLELGMETTNHHILETVALNLRPILNLIRGYILGIAGHIIRGISIRTLCTDGSHQLVILIGDEVLGSHLRHRVNLVIGLFAALGIGEFTIGLVALFNLCQ